MPLARKGFGFKAVFGIADRVHIQSGAWSFRFEHSRNQDGLGMVTPLWTANTPTLQADVGTRFTLQYDQLTAESLENAGRRGSTICPR